MFQNLDEWWLMCDLSDSDDYIRERFLKRVGRLPEKIVRDHNAAWAGPVLNCKGNAGIEKDETSQQVVQDMEIK